MNNILVENESLDNIIKGISLNLFEIDKLSNIRIFSKQKPGYMILAVEADISEDIVAYITSDYQEQQKDMKFESTVFDYVAVNFDNQTKLLSTISLIELIQTNKILESETQWTMDSKEFMCIEINVEKDLTIENDILKSDMKVFG